jgi:hypothetical protein
LTLARLFCLFDCAGNGGVFVIVAGGKTTTVCWRREVCVVVRVSGVSSCGHDTCVNSVCMRACRWRHAFEVLADSGVWQWRRRRSSAPENRGVCCARQCENLPASAASSFAPSLTVLAKDSNDDHIDC